MNSQKLLLNQFPLGIIQNFFTPSTYIEVTVLLSAQNIVISRGSSLKGQPLKQEITNGRS